MASRGHSISLIIPKFTEYLFSACVFGHGFSVKAPDDETGAPVIAEIAPNPVYECHHFIPKSYQRHEMHEHPDEPGKKSLEADLPHIYHGQVSPYGGHAALVE